MVCCGIWDKFDDKSNLIKEYKHWKLLVRNKQIKLGSCVAIARRHLGSLSEISGVEMKEYAEVSRDIESALKKSFGYDVIHHLLLMFFDKHVHFHIIPRYKEPRDFAGIEWVDSFHPNPLVGKPEEPASQHVLDKIKEEIVRNM